MQRILLSLAALSLLAAACSTSDPEEVTQGPPPSDTAAAQEQIDEQTQLYTDRVAYAVALEEAQINLYAAAVWSNEWERQQEERRAAELAAQQAAQAAAAAQATSYSGGGSSASNYASGDPGLAGIRACESGGNYATNTGNGYYGAYQFDIQTWNSVGGSGLPSDASPSEQDARAQALIAQRGTSPWPTCG